MVTGWASFTSYHGRRRKNFMVDMYCVKCKEKKTVPDSATTKAKTVKGRNMLRAICPTCGTKMTKFTK